MLGALGDETTVIEGRLELTETDADIVAAPLSPLTPPDGFVVAAALSVLRENFREYDDDSEDETRVAPASAADEDAATELADIEASTSPGFGLFGPTARAGTLPTCLFCASKLLLLLEAEEVEFMLLDIKVGFEAATEEKVGFTVLLEGLLVAVELFTSNAG